MKVQMILLVFLSTVVGWAQSSPGASINADKTQKTLIYEYSPTHSKHVFYSLSEKGECQLTQFEFSEEKGTESKQEAADSSNCQDLVIMK